MNWDLFFAFILGFTMGVFIGIYISYKAAGLTEPRHKRKKHHTKPQGSRTEGDA